MTPDSFPQAHLSPQRLMALYLTNYFFVLE